MKRSILTMTAGASVWLLAAGFQAGCGGGGDGTGTPATDSDAVNEPAASSAPLSGQFLATCEDGVATLEEFVAGSPFDGEPGDLPTAEEVFASGDPNGVPVIGGLVPSGLPGGLEPISIEDAMAMIPSGGLSGSLPVLGTAPVVCGTAALVLDELPTPTNAPGVIPVFDPDGDPVALILATVGGGSAPDDLALPEGVDVLPDSFSNTIALLLFLLGPTAGDATGSSGQLCGGPFVIPCPEGEICVAAPGEWGVCQGL